MRLGLLIVLFAFVSVAQAQDAADYDWENLTFYVAGGSHHSGYMSLEPAYDGSHEPFMGCAHAYLLDREGQDFGMFQVIAKYRDQHMNIYFAEFEGQTDEMDGGLVQDILVDGSHDHPGQIQHPAVFAGMAGWGYAQMDLVNTRIFDPVTGSGSYKASMFITPNGFRDDETQAIYDTDGGIWSPGKKARVGHDDWEMHMRIESPPEARQADFKYVYKQPPRVAADQGYFQPDEAYQGGFLFDNQRFGGNVTIQIDFESIAQAGDNRLEFILWDPEGAMLDSVVLEPDLLNPASHTMHAPLNLFGKYSLQVKGHVALSKYDVRMTQHTPDQFDMHFWWNNVTFAGHATQTLWDCQEDVGYVEEMAESIVKRDEPPTFAWVPIGFGIAITVLGIITAGKLIHMSYLQGK